MWLHRSERQNCYNYPILLTPVTCSSRPIKPVEIEAFLNVSCEWSGTRAFTPSHVV